MIPPAPTDRSILLVDDETSALNLYAGLLEEQGFRRVTKVRQAHHARRLAEEQSFDLILIDVTMNFQGSDFGGFELYKALLPRYGDSALLLYSQFINDSELEKHQLRFNFIEKQVSAEEFGPLLAEEIRRLLAQQTCFIAMPFAPAFRPLYQSILGCVREAGFTCVRMDEVHFTAQIVQKMMENIRRSKVVLFVATDRNPNVFYECGYASALNKEMIMITDDCINLPFNVRGHRAIEYRDLDSLRSELRKEFDLLLGQTSQRNGPQGRSL